MRSTRPARWAVPLVLAGSLALAACGNSGSNSASGSSSSGGGGLGGSGSSQTYKIAFQGPLSGDNQQLGINEVNGAFDYTGNPAPYVAYPDFPDVTKGIVEWQQRMGAFTKKSSFFGLTITEPNRWANLADSFEQLEDDVVRGRKKISDVQQAVSDWKSKGGDDLRDWYKKLLDDTGSAK